MTAYRLRLRLLASLERVRAGDPLVDIALAHGFSSHSHFSAAFRAAFGMTPSAWRTLTASPAGTPSLRLPKKRRAAR
jgi:AraC-like DNA-binding protein